MLLRQLPPSTVNEQAQRQLMSYWRGRVGAALDQLEAEVRRMARVESGLEQFAQEMVQRLHPYTEAVRQLPADMAAQLALPQAPFQWVAWGVGAARAREMKQRYQRLAKEIRPDFTGDDTPRPCMRDVNHAYARGDLAALVRLEAQLLAPGITEPTSIFEEFVREVERAAHTYRAEYKQLLHTPLYALYARAASAREDGWDYTETLIRRIGRAAGAVDYAHQAA